MRRLVDVNGLPSNPPRTPSAPGHLGALLLVSALAALAAGCGGGGGFPDAPPPPPTPDPGTFTIDWSLTDSSGKPVSCTQVSATMVIINLEDALSGDAFSASFPCDLGAGVSGSLPASTYDVKFYLIGAMGPIASAPPVMGVMIQSDMTAHLDPIVFAVF